MWVLGTLISTNILVLGILGKFIKETYDITTDLDVLLNGTSKDQKGFVEQSRESHQRLAQEQTELRERMQAQGRLSEQTAYAVQELAEAIDDMNGHSVDTERLSDLQGRYRDEREGDDD